jgi:ParB-like chromosome segregation protein Spo0J
MDKTKDKPKTYTDGTLSYIPLSHVRMHDDIPYRPLDKDHVTVLRKSIEANGLEQPLLVWNGDEDGSKGTTVQIEGKPGQFPAAWLIAGNHRRQALREFAKDNNNGFKERFPNGVPVLVKSGPLSDVLMAMLRENVTRKEMTIQQVLPVIKKLQELGLKQKVIAKSIGRSEGFISQVLSAEEELGEEETKDLAESGASITELREAAKKVKEVVKKGGDKKAAAKEIVAKTKGKVAQKKASGRQREEKRVSAKTIFKRYHALPRTLKMGDKVNILESALGYLAGEDTFDLPEELQADAEEGK